MHPIDLIRPLARPLLADALRQSRLLPSPANADRQLVSGPRPDRILVFGGGIACGLGVLGQEQALPGRLAVALSHATGRGAAVDVVASRSLLVADAVERLHTTRLTHFDGLVIALGTADGYRLTTLSRWRAGLDRLLDDVARRAAPGTVTVVTGTSPMPRTFMGNELMLAMWDAQARRMDRVTEEVCAARPDVAFTPLGLPAKGRGQVGGGEYDTIAQRVSAPLAPRLTELDALRPSGCARDLRGEADPELLRQRALDQTGLLEPGCGGDRRLLRLLRQARDLLGTRAAAVTLVDGEELRSRAVVGTDAFVVPRGDAACDRTIRKDEAHVEADLTGHPMAEAGWYFYAGFPLEAPDGYRIGALCVLDDRPRSSTSVDPDVLRELAARVQNELWVEIGRSRVAT